MGELPPPASLRHFHLPCCFLPTLHIPFFYSLHSYTSACYSPVQYNTVLSCTPSSVCVGMLWFLLGRAGLAGPRSDCAPPGSPASREGHATGHGGLLALPLLVQNCTVLYSTVP